MDFFDRQEAARKKSKLLVLYFSIGVLGVAGSIGVLAAWVMMKVDPSIYGTMDHSIIFKVGGVTLIIILLGK